MTLEELFLDKSITAKAKAKEICVWLMSGQVNLEELMAFAERRSPVDEATCIEAMECATKKSEALGDESLMAYVSNALTADEPRVKWESAKVVGNIARKFPSKLAKPTENLLNNANDSGTVVRWATAYALAEILKVQPQNMDLRDKIEGLSKNEPDGGVRKKYLDALKKVNSHH